LLAPTRVGHAHGPKAHDGTITVDSIPGCTAFTVRFPFGAKGIELGAQDEGVAVREDHAHRR